jgi:hypothetical protein
MGLGASGQMLHYITKWNVVGARLSLAFFAWIN